MSDEKMVSEVEAVKRERKAYIRGAASGAVAKIHGAPVKIEVEAARVYPLPKVKRPRVVRMGWSEVRIVDGRLQARGIGSGAGEWHLNITTVEQLRDVASLLENPDEEVEAE